MELNSRSKMILGGIAVFCIVAAIALFFARQPASPPPSGVYYYTGPMRNKKNPNIWGDASGRQVPAPPDAFPVPASKDASAGPTGGASATQ